MSSDGAKLVLAAQKGNDAKVKRLLKAKADMNATVADTTGTQRLSALQIASGQGHVGAVCGCCSNTILG